MKLTKLQREAFKMARWWMDGDDFSEMPSASEKVWELDDEAWGSVETGNSNANSLHASAILSEVM
jgi:hypothetical protein